MNLHYRYGDSNLFTRFLKWLFRPEWDEFMSECRIQQFEEYLARRDYYETYEKPVKGVTHVR
jgi:hypothetical protein